jgi:hypothetical protein
MFASSLKFSFFCKLLIIFFAEVIAKTERAGTRKWKKRHFRFNPSREHSPQAQLQLQNLVEARFRQILEFHNGKLFLKVSSLTNDPIPS